MEVWAYHWINTLVLIVMLKLGRNMYNTSLCLITLMMMSTMEFWIKMMRKFHASSLNLRFLTPLLPKPLSQQKINNPWPALLLLPILLKHLLRSNRQPNKKLILVWTEWALLGLVVAEVWNQVNLKGKSKPCRPPRAQVIWRRTRNRHSNKLTLRSRSTT